ncbi:fibroblast growth factor receptor 1-like isoform X2 [Oscarella lobularis]
MWTRNNYPVKFSFGSAVGDSRIVSKIHFSSLHQDSLTTGKVSYIGNQPREEAINSTEFFVTFTCASKGVSSTTFLFNITGNSSNGACETTGRFSIKKSCSGSPTSGSPSGGRPTSTKISLIVTTTPPSTSSPSLTTSDTTSGTSRAFTSALNTPRPKTLVVLFLAVVVSAFVLLIALTSTFAVVMWKRRKNKFPHVEEGALAISSKRCRWEVNPGKIQLDAPIGSGAFSRVYRGEYSCTVIAVKVLKADSQSSEREMLLKEIELLKNMEPHSNLITMKGCCTVSPDSPIMLIMEYMNMGNLLKYLRKNRCLKCVREECEERLNDPTILTCVHNQKLKEFLNQCLVITYQVSLGMEWMEKQHCVHRDLAARNVLLHALDDKRIITKISDFGLARSAYESDMIRGDMHEQKPIKWTAPEGLFDDIFTIKSDVWSFGVVLWEVASLGSIPYPGLEKQVLVTMIQNGYRMDKPEDCSDELYQLMLQCWQSLPNKRPRFEKIRTQLEEMVTTTRGYIDL